MTRSSKIIWSIVIVTVFTVFAIGYEKAYGNEYTELIEIPIPDNVTGMESKKQLTKLTEDLLEYTITLRFHLGQDGVQWFEDELQQLGLTPPDITLCPDRFYLDIDGETCYPNPPIESNFIPEDKPDDLLRFEALLEELNEKGTQSFEDIEDIAKLQELKKCLQGLDNTRGIQSVREFFTSGYDDVPLVPKFSNSSELDKAIEECKGQLLHINTILGRGEPTKEGDYLSQQDYFGREQVYHGDKVIIDPDVWAAIPTHESDSTEVRHSNAYLEREEITAQDLMCNSDKVTLKFKVQQGCEDIKIWHDGEYTIHGEETTEYNDTLIGLGKPVIITSTKASDGGGDIPVNGWNMYPQSKLVEMGVYDECSTMNYTMPSAYHRAICGTVPNE